MAAAKPQSAPERQRDREATMRLLIDAVGRVLARQGFREVKVNVVAREAGINKVLIYRYFGGLDGLVTAFAHNGDFWPDLDELTGGDREAFLALPFAERLVVAARNYMRGIRRRPLTQEILAWRFLEHNALTEALDSVRQSVGMQLMALVRSDLAVPPDLDTAALYAILGGTINHLSVRGRTEETFAGLPLDDEATWERLEAMLARIIRSVLGNVG